MTGNHGGHRDGAGRKKMVRTPEDQHAHQKARREMQRLSKQKSRTRQKYNNTDPRPRAVTQLTLPQIVSSPPPIVSDPPPPITPAVRQKWIQ